MIRAPINALRKDASIALIWRTRPDPRRGLIAAAVTFLVLLAAGFSLGAAIVGVVLAAVAVGLIAITRARRVPAIIDASASEVASSLGISIAKQPKDEAR